jgi:hypothetical protein
LNLTPAAVYANNVNAGTASASYTYEETANYLGSSDSKTFEIGKAATVTTVTINGGPFTYTGSAIEPATVTVTGPGGLNLTPAAVYANNVNAGTASASYTYEETANYLGSSDSKTFEIGKAATVTTVTINGGPFTYTGSAIEPATVTVTGPGGLNLTPAAVYANNVNAGTASASYTYEETANYLGSSDSKTFEIGKAALTITANDASKYTGQANPAFSVSYSGFVGGETESELGGTLTFTTPADQGSCAGEYAIIPSGLTSDNYALTFVPGTLTINSISIDASASSTPVQINTSATLSATVTPNVAGVSVTFTLTNDANAVVFSQTVLTNASGVATTTVPSSVIGSNPTVYKVDATAGSDCSNSVAYLPVFDPNANFVTGGGWITSPYVANAEYMQVEGRANFGFVSRYKKGTNNVDGNTEFQFQAGNLNFKSTMHESGSLVISGNRATYRGTGTINGMTGYKFVVVAIDGHLNGGTNPDRFRIKITRTADDVVVYDNQFGSDENTADATILGNNGTGGGSIVIHQVKTSSGGKKREAATEAEIVTEPTVAMETMSIDVYPNPMRGNVIVRFDNPDRAPVQLSLMDMSGRQVQVQVTETTEGYVLYTQDLTNGFYFLRLRVGNRMEGIKLLKQD